MFIKQTTNADFVAGLRALADFLTANPDLPIPSHGTEILLFTYGTDAQQDAGVKAVARLLNVRAKRRSGRVSAQRRFGPVTYRIVAIPAAERAAHDALMTYAGTVQPDGPASDADEQIPDRKEAPSFL